MTEIRLMEIAKKAGTPAGSAGADVGALWRPIAEADKGLQDGLEQNRNAKYSTIGRIQVQRSQEHMQDAEQQIKEMYEEEAGKAIVSARAALDDAIDKRTREYYDKAPRMDEQQRGIRDDVTRLYNAKLGAIKMPYERGVILQTLAGKTVELLEAEAIDALPHLFALQELAPELEIPESWWDASSGDLAQARANLVAARRAKQGFEARMSARALKAGGLTTLESIEAKSAIHEAGYNSNDLSSIIGL